MGPVTKKQGEHHCSRGTWGIHSLMLLSSLSGPLLSLQGSEKCQDCGLLLYNYVLGYEFWT